MKKRCQHSPYKSLKNDVNTNEDIFEMKTSSISIPLISQLCCLENTQKCCRKTLGQTLVETESKFALKKISTNDLICLFHIKNVIKSLHGTLSRCLNSVLFSLFDEFCCVYYSVF